MSVFDYSKYSRHESHQKGQKGRTSGVFPLEDDDEIRPGINKTKIWRSGSTDETSFERYKNTGRPESGPFVSCTFYDTGRPDLGPFVSCAFSWYIVHLSIRVHCYIRVHFNGTLVHKGTLVHNVHWYILMVHFNGTLWLSVARFLIPE